MARVWEAARDRLLGRHTIHDGTFNGQQLVSFAQSMGSVDDLGEFMPQTFAEFAEFGAKENGPVFAAMAARALLFSEAEFQFQNIRTRALFGGPGLSLLENPWEGGTQRDLMMRAEIDNTLQGTFFARRVDGNRLERLRPDWVEIMGFLTSGGAHRTLGYTYYPGGKMSSNEGIFIDVEDMIQWGPIPDPMSPLGRGISWLTPVVREISADKKMSQYQVKFFDNAATPNMLVIVKDRLQEESRERLRKALDLRHAGVDNAYKTMVIDGGPDVKVIGNTFEQISFAQTRAATENRIAVASGVPSVILGLKEGLQAATYSNFAQAMRRFVDLTARPLWGSFAGACEDVIEVPPGARLWYDDRRIPALKQDAKDEADIRSVNAGTISALITAGFQPDSAVSAVKSGDLSLLKHTGLTSVQLLPPGEGDAGSLDTDDGSEQDDED